VEYSSAIRLHSLCPKKDNNLMAFTYSGGIITQTGTDTNLAGLSGITGVNVITYGLLPFSVYDMGTNRLDIEGSLTIDPEANMFISNAPTGVFPNGALNVRNTGTLTLGVKTVVGTAVKYTQGTAFILAERGNLNTDASLIIEDGGTFNAYGAEIKMAGPTRCMNGSYLNIEDLTLTSIRQIVCQFRIEHNSASTTSRVSITNNGMTLNGRTSTDSARVTTLGAVAFPSSSFIFNFIRGQYQPAAGGYPDQVFLNFDNGNNVDGFDFAYAGSGGTNGTQYNGKLVDFRNVARRVRYTQANSKGGFSKTTKVVSFNLLTQLGGALSGVSYYSVDVNNGNRITFNGFDSTADIVYQGQNVGPALEVIPTIEFMAGESTTRFVDDRTNSDTLTFQFVSYLTNIAVNSPNLIGLKTLEIDVVNPDDTSITETTRATVDAYSTLDTPAKLYDRAKSYLVTNYLGEAEATLAKSGDTIDAKALNVIIDATATQTFLLSGNTLTIKASTFTGDMTTTGVITLANGAVFLGTRTDANGTVLPLRNISVTGLTAGSRLRVYNETTSTQIVNTVVSGTSYTATYAEGTGYSANDVLSLRIAKIDKLEAIASVVVSATGWTALISQDANPVYAAHGVNGATVTGITWDSGNMQFDFNETDNVINGPDIGAWYQYFITTEVGIAEAFGALVWPQINRLTNVTSKTAITWDNTKSTPLQINSAWVDRDDGASIIAATSNSIQINPPAVFVKDVANISAIKAKTDLLNFTGTDVKATLDGEEVVTDTASRNASKADLGTVETELGTIDISLQQRNVPIIEQPKKSNYGQSGF
jgi:hypothetical protein